MVLGENALAVSRYSKHVDPGVALVKYLTRRDVQLDRARTTALPPTLSALYDDPEILKTSPDDMPLQKIFLASAVSRPSSVTGRKYADVSRAYFRAVHSVLTRQQKPSAAAATLERELVWITGLPTRRLSPGAPGFAAPGS
jgi:trehalose/maltose transport system substrate-binding protein